MKALKQKKIVVIGGGTGTFVALTGLKKYPIHLSAIVTMMDSGGSTGRLRDQLGVLPPGDLRQALVALSRSEKIWRDLFVYRFVNGDLNGHNFGNIFISALEKVTGSIERAIALATTILDVDGSVIPVTFTKSELCVELSDGKIIEGETHIDEQKEATSRPRIIKAYLQPKAPANQKAIDAIASADLIVIGPGDLYTSLVPNLLVDGVARAICRSKAKKVFVMNLMTKHGQTTDYTAAEHVADLEKYLSCSVDYVLVNTKKPRPNTLAWYTKSHETVVEDDLSNSSKVRVVHGAFLDDAIIVKPSSDVLNRSIIRHNPRKLAQALIALL